MVFVSPKWSSDLKYGPCPPARDLGSRVSGSVFFCRCCQIVVVKDFIFVFDFIIVIVSNVDNNDDGDCECDDVRLDFSCGHATL